MAIPALPSATVIDTDLRVGDVATMTSHVDEDGARRIMGMLVDMYSDPATAVVREYVANAVDATIAAVSMVPVQVSTPDELTPNLVVADRGTGMSASEVESVFLAFAASTKRDTNTQVGGLGVGAKSAWTVAESFVIETVKAGRRTVVRAARDLQHHVLVADAATDLPQGTSITIPVGANDVARWRTIVESVAAAHRPGMVVVDGQPAASIQGGPRWIGPVRYGSISKERNHVAVLSGGTLFAVPADLAARVLAQVQTGCVLELPVGSFDHTPSRESLIATVRTEAAVERAMTEFTRQWKALGERITRLTVTDVQAAQQLRAATLGGDGNYLHLPIDAAMALTEDVRVFARTPSSRRRSWTAATAEDTVPITMFRQWCTGLLIVSGLPNTRTLRGIAKYVKSFAPSTTTVLTLRGETETAELPVVGSDQTITVGIHTPEATVVSYTEMQKQLAGLRADQRRTQTDPTYTVRVKQDGRVSVEELTLAQIAALTTTILYAAAGWSEVPASLDEGVLVLLDRKSPARFAAAMPHAIRDTQWNAHCAEQLTTVATDLDLEAVAMKSSEHKAVFALAASMEDVPATHPAAQTLHRMHAVHHRAFPAAASPDQALDALAQAIRLHKTPQFLAAARRVADLAETIQTMYPLMKLATARNVNPNRHEIAHLNQYLVAVAPMPTATSASIAA